MRQTRSVAAVVRMLRAGGTVVVPTDTAYALAADATNRAAVLKVKRLKGRDARKPIAVMAADIAQVRRCFVLPRAAEQLVRKFWPGPLTIVLKPKSALAKGGLSRGGIGVRVPANVTARRIAQRLGKPITATSANRAGGPTPYTPTAIARQFHATQPDVILNAGRLLKRPVSTVVRLRGRHIEILRPGAIPERKLHGLR